MARRNDHTKEEIRKMIITTGSSLIEKSGFSCFSTRQIAKEIGYTVGTLYNVFDSYDDIILHINATILDEMKDFIQQNLDSNLRKSDAIKQLAYLYIEFSNKNYNKWSALFEYSISEDLEIPEFYSKRIDDLFSILEKILLDFINHKSECSKYAKVIWSSIHGICVLGLTKKLDVIRSDSVKELTDSLIDNYLKGIEVTH